MKNKLFCLVFSIISVNLSIAQTFVFSDSYARNQTAVSGERNEWKDMQTDAMGYTYVILQLHTNETFNAQSYVVDPIFKDAGLLIKYAPNGNIVWTSFLDSSAFDVLLLDPAGNPVIVGTKFTGYTDTPSGFFPSHRFSIFKFDAVSGNLMWQNTALTGNVVQTGSGVIDATWNSAGDLYIATKAVPQVSENINWGNIVNWSVNTGSGDTGEIIIKADNLGNPMWVKLVLCNAINPVEGFLTSITAGDNNEIYVSGRAQKLYGQNGNQGIFVTRVDSSGALEWFIDTANESTDDHTYSVLFHQGSLYVSGKADGGGPDSLDFGNGVISVANYPRSFIAKLTPQGQGVWMKLNTNATFSDDLRILELVALPSGDIGMLAYFKGSNVDFAGFILNSSLYFGFPQIDADVFVMDTNGSLKGVTYVTQFNTATPISISAAPDSCVWLCGIYRGTITIGTNVLPQYAGNNDYNLYIAKVKPALGLSGVFDNDEAEISSYAYPNPTNGKLILRMNFLSKRDVSKIEIFNMLGSSVFMTRSLYDEIDLSDIPNGTYIIRYSGDTSSSVSEKLIIQR